MIFIIIYAISVTLGLVAAVWYIKKEKENFLGKIKYDQLKRCETLDLFLDISESRKNELGKMVGDIVSLVNSLQEEINMIKMLTVKHKLTVNEQFFILYALAKIRGAHDGKRDIMKMIDKLFSKLGGKGIMMSNVDGIEEIKAFGKDVNDDDDEEEPDSKKEKKDEPPASTGDAVID